MAASGYMTELDTESIWSSTLDTTRFGKINVRFGEILNFYCRKNHDAATDITDTAVLPILEQVSEEALYRLMAAAKIDKHTNPWDFIQANVVSVMSKVIRDNLNLLEIVKEQLESKLHVKISSKLTLTSHSD